MKTSAVFKFLLLLCLFSLSSLGVHSWGQEMNMPQFGKHKVVITNDTLVYDHRGPDGSLSSLSHNSAACVQFVSADPNKAVVIDFEYIDMHSSLASYPAYLKIYQGECDDSHYTWPESTSGVNIQTMILPQGQIDSLSGSYEGKTYVAESDQGISIGFMYKYADYSDGFKARVYCVEKTPMEITEAGSFYQQPSQMYPGLTQVNLLSFYLQASGLSQPDTLTEFRFHINSENLPVEESSLHLYQGSSSSVSNLKEVEAQLSQEGDGYVFRCRQPLVSGRNEFCVGATLKNDMGLAGEMFSVEAVSLSTYKHSSGFAAFQVSEEVPQYQLLNLLLLSSQGGEYTVSDTIWFYDDGGADGKISEQFEGWATFVPQTPGKAIEMDFRKISLFNTSSIGLNDVLKIYDGKERDEARLNTVLLKQTTAKVRSLSDDGSLTLYLKSTTGIPKDGFEAVVSEIEVLPMVFQGTNQFCDTNLHAAQGDSVILLGVNIQTSGLRPMLELKKMAFDFSSCSREGLIASASLWSMGKDSVFVQALAQELCRKELGGNTSLEMEVKDKATLTLSEGNNYFYLMVTLTSEALDGDYIGALCTSVELSDGSSSNTHTLPSVELPQIPVVNEYLSQVGSFVKTFRKQLTFKPTPSSYGSAYETPTSAQQVTFLPLTPGRVAQIEFSMFDLYFRDYYGSTDHDIFKIYSGGTDGELLWEFSEKDQKNLGPGKVLRSKAADGSLTVVFQPKASSSASAGKGFKALVSEYEPVDVDIVAASGYTLGSGVARIGQEDLPLLGMKLDVFGTLGQLELRSLGLDWKQSEDKVDSVFVYLSSDSIFSSENLSSARLLMKGKPSSVLNLMEDGQTDQGEGSISAPTLEEGTYYLWLLVNTSADAASQSVLDAAWTSVVTNREKTYDIAQPDPEGEWTLMSMYLLQDGDNGRVKVNGRMMFYDEGGPDGPHGKTAFDGKVTFVPGQEGQVIRMRILEFQTYTSNQELYIYSGSQVADSCQMAKCFYKTYSTNKMVSRDSEGSMTARFVMPEQRYGTPAFGWVIEVESVEPLPMRIDSITTQPVAQDFVAPYMENVEILHLQAYPHGDLGQCELRDLELDLEGTDVDIYQLSVYALGTDTTFSVATAGSLLMGSVDTVKAGTSRVRIQGKASVDLEAIHHLYVVYSLGDAAQGGKVSIRPVAAKAMQDGEIQDVEVKPLPCVHEISQGISGTFVVGLSSQAQYAEIQEAIDALKAGVSGPVTLLLEDGEYDEVVVIPEIPGLSSHNTLHITSLSQDAAKVTVASDNYVEYIDYATLTRNPNEGVFNIAGASHVKVSHITFTTTNMEFPSLVFAYKASRHLEFSHLRLLCQRLSGSYSEGDIDLLGLGTSLDIPNYNCDDVKVSQCYFEGGYIGLNLGGSGVIAWGSKGKVQQLLVEDNTFVDQASKAIYLHDAEDFVIRGNSISCRTASSASFWAMDIYRSGVSQSAAHAGSSVPGSSIGSTLAGKSEISANEFRIEVSNTKAANAMYFRPLYGRKGNPVKIYNNVVQFTKTQSTSYGIFFADGPNEYLEFAHNTVLLGGEILSDYSAVVGLDNDAEPNQVNWTNNLFQNHVGGFVYRLNRASDTALMQWKRNGVYAPEDHFARVSEEMSYSGWKKAVGKDYEPVFDSAVFLSETMLGLKELKGFDTGLTLDWVKTDILGIERGPRPTLGAYEFESGLDMAPEMLAGYPQIGQLEYNRAELKVKMNQSGRIYAWVVEKDAVVPTDSAALSDTVLKVGRVFELSREKETSLWMDSLQPSTVYKAWLLMENFNQKKSAVLASPDFKTLYPPTEVSTFEKIALGTDTAFVDGTARFEGFQVVADSSLDAGAPMGPRRAAMKGSAEIRILNTDTGLVLNGFYYKSLSDAELKLSRGKLEGSEDGDNSQKLTSKEESTLVVPASFVWTYFNLRDKGMVSALSLKSADSLWLDDFSGEPKSLKLAPMPSDTAVKIGNTLRLMAKVACGVPPYNYLWTNVAGDTLSKKDILELKAETTVRIRLDVQDAWRRKVSHWVEVVVGGDQVATFENLLKDEDSQWYGEKNGDNYFYSGMFRFDNQYNATYNSWKGFAYANWKTNAYDMNIGYGNQYRNVVGGGADSSASYAVVFDTAVMEYVVDTLGGMEIVGMYVTNNVMTRQSVLEGDDFAGEPFHEGDYFKMLVHGQAPDGSVKTLEYYLADYRSQDTAEHYLVNHWEWMDLSSLGKVKRLGFSFDASRRNAYGLLTPTYAMLDNINSSYAFSLLRADSLKEGSRLALQQDAFFQMPGNGIYQIEIVASEGSASASLKVEGDSLVVNALTKGEASFTLKATRNGHSVYARWDVSVGENQGGGVDVEGIGQLSGSALIVNLWPVPARDVLHITSNSPVTFLEVFDLSGRRIHSRSLAPSGSASTTTQDEYSLDLSTYRQGTYLVRLHTSYGVKTLRFVKM